MIEAAGKQWLSMCLKIVSSSLDVRNGECDAERRRWRDQSDHRTAAARKVRHLEASRLSFRSFGLRGRKTPVGPGHQRKLRQAVLKKRHAWAIPVVNIVSARRTATDPPHLRIARSAIGWLSRLIR